MDLEAVKKEYSILNCSKVSCKKNIYKNETIFIRLASRIFFLSFAHSEISFSSLKNLRKVPIEMQSADRTQITLGSVEI
jgi:hypothetical protein